MVFFLTSHDASANFWPQMTNKDPVPIFFPGDNEKCFAGIQTIHVFVYTESSFGAWSFYTKGTVPCKRQTITYFLIARPGSQSSITLMVCIMYICSSDQKTNSESTNPEFSHIFQCFLCVSIDFLVSSLITWLYHNSKLVLPEKEKK